MIAALLVRFKGWLIAAGAFLAALFYAWFSGRSGARQEAQRDADAALAKRNEKAANEIHEAVKERNDVENNIGWYPRAARDRMRDEWTRED